MLSQESQESGRRIPTPPISLYQLEKMSASAGTFDRLPFRSRKLTGQLGIIIRGRGDRLVTRRRFVAEQERPQAW
jgi:hypothetical protein